MNSNQTTLIPVTRTHPLLTRLMAIHYSKPKGFVGRNICYLIFNDWIFYGAIVGGSATRFLPNREIIGSLNNGVNNIFFHVHKVDGKYPCREFTVKVLRQYRTTIVQDWKRKYGDDVLWHETLIEKPRTGECYRRDGWKLVGTTKGFTCKRTAGQGTDSWSGKRIWDTKNLKPKLVYLHE